MNENIGKGRLKFVITKENIYSMIYGRWEKIISLGEGLARLPNTKCLPE